MRIWTKSVAGDSEAPSLESRWMWRYPVGRVTRLQVCCPPPCRPRAGHIPPLGLGPSLILAQGRLPQENCGPGEQGLGPQTSVPSHPHQPHQPCFRLLRGSVNWPTKSLGEVVS